MVETGNEINNLTANYDVRTFSICNIRFESFVDYQSSIHFGYEEGAFLVINKLTGEIETRETAEGWVYAHCAKDEEHFLSAIFQLFKNSQYPYSGNDTPEEIKRMKLASYAASEAAGGEAYEIFYLEMTGYNSLGYSYGEDGIKEL